MESAKRLSTWRVVASAAATSALLAACGTTLPQTTTRSLAVQGSKAPNAEAGGSGSPAQELAGTTGTLGTTGSQGTTSGMPSGTSGGTTSTSGTGGGTTSPATGGGVTAPLTVGVTYINNDATSSALGATTSGTVNQKTIVEAMIRGLNASGGVDGRQLKAIEYEWKSNSNDWSSDATSACQKFTKDNHVSVVLDTAFGTTGGFRDCLQAAGVMDITSQVEGDAAGSRGAPLHANTSSMTTERTYSAVLKALAKSSYLSKANQIGVIVENCAENSKPYSQTLKPLMSSLGLKPPKEAMIDCTTGFNSATTAAPAINNAVLTFKSAGVDRVMFISSGQESVMLLLFARDADSQGYRPGYLLSSQAQAALRDLIPSGQWPQLHGVGNAPYSDVDAPAVTGVDKRCLQLAKSGGVAASASDYGLVVFECGPFLLLQAALQATRGDSDAKALSDAIDQLGTRFLAPGVLGAATRFGPTRRDGPDLVQVFGFVAACKCLRYTGTPQSAPQ